MCVCVCVCVCVCARVRVRVCGHVCHNEQKVPNECQARQSTQATLVSSGEKNAKKNTTTASSLSHQSITAILTEEKQKQSAKPTHAAVYLFQDSNRECACAHTRMLILPDLQSRTPVLS